MTSAISDWEIERREDALPAGWAEATLGEIVVHKLGGLWGVEPARAATDPALVRVRVIRGTDFRDWDRHQGTTAAERAIPRARLAERRLAAGDLVVEISGGGAGQPVGRTLLIDEAAIQRADAPLICSNFCRQVRIHPAIDPAFVHLVLQLRYLCGSLDEHQTQTTNLRNLSFQGFLSGVVLAVPPRAEQRRIVARVAELLTQVQRARESLARASDALRRFRQSVLAEAVAGRLTEGWRNARYGAQDRSAGRLERVFAARLALYEQSCRRAEACGRRTPRRPPHVVAAGWEAPEPLAPPEVPDNWTVAALQDLAHRVQYGLSVKTQGNAKSGVPILRMANIQDGELDAAALKYADRQGLDLEHFTLRRGDVLFNRTNSAEQVGKAAVFDLDLEAVFASYLVRIECDERLVCGRYLCAWINSPWGRRWARTVRTDCSNQSNVNVARLRRMPVPLPPLAEQSEIVRLIAACFAVAGAAEARVMAAAERVERVRRAVLARAMRGELVPTDAELAADRGGPAAGACETGAEVLERIAADRLDVSDRVLAAIRQACWGAGELSRAELVQRVAGRLELKLGKRTRACLERHVDAAIARRIVAARGGRLTGATPTFGRYDYDYLLTTARSLTARGVETERDEVVRALAAWLGYGQVTPAIRERMDRVFHWAAQVRQLELRDRRIVFR